MKINSEEFSQTTYTNSRESECEEWKCIRRGERRSLLYTRLYSNYKDLVFNTLYKLTFYYGFEYKQVKNCNI